MRHGQPKRVTAVVRSRFHESDDLQTPDGRRMETSNA